MSEFALKIYGYKSENLYPKKGKFGFAKERKVNLNFSKCKK